MRVPIALLFASVALFIACAGKPVGFTPGPASETSANSMDQTGALGMNAPSRVKFYTVGSGPNDYTGYDALVGNDGMIYYTALAQSTCDPSGDCGARTGIVGQLNPSSGTFTEVPLVGAQLGLAQTSDGAIWVAEGELAYSKTIGQLARISPFTPSGVTVIPLPPGTPGATPQPRALAMGGDGNLWFTDQLGSRVGKIPPSGPYMTNAMTMYPMPTGAPGTIQSFAGPKGIAAGPGSTMWIVDARNGTIYKSTSTGSMTGYITPEQLALGNTNSSFPEFIARGSNGKMYFTQLSTPGTFESVSSTGSFTHIEIPKNAIPYLMRSGSDKVAFADYSNNNAIGIYSVNSNTFEELPIVPPQPSFRYNPSGVAVAGDGSIWFMCYGPPPAGSGISVGHLTLTSTWEVFPRDVFSVKVKTSQLIGLGESGDSGPFTATSSNALVATVASAHLAHDDHNFIVTGVAAGTATITITDAHSRSVPLTVTVKP